MQPAVQGVGVGEYLGGRHPHHVIDRVGHVLVGDIRLQPLPLSHWLAGGRNAEPLETVSPLNPAVTLSLRLIPYSDDLWLLVARDVSRLLHLEQMRRDFVANVSHEIRTPLTVLSGFVETLQTIPLNEQERQNYLQLMSVQAERMQSLVADLLTLSQLEGSSPPGNHEQVPLPELMTQVAADAAALSAVLSGQEGDERGPVHVLNFDTQADWALLGVRSELLSAVSNLVSNAVRYTPAGGRVELRWTRREDGTGLFEVQDNGPGIARERFIVFIILTRIDGRYSW